MSTASSKSTVLVINSGSSSLKYQLIDPVNRTAIANGLVERIGEPGGRVVHNQGSERHEQEDVVPDHAHALRLVYAMFKEAGLDLDTAGVAAVGHRVSHGGLTFRQPAVATDDVINEIKRLSTFAPLHNPANAMGIEAAKERFPSVPHVAVFDTGFFSTLPESVTTVPIDQETARTYGIRRFGFHGTSHSYVSEQTAVFLGRDLTELNTIVLHLGNGASAAAVRGGLAEDISLGMTTVSGMIMGTRPGDLDPGIIVHLMRSAKMDADQIDDLIYRRSGLKGMCGDNDFRTVVDRMEAGDEAATLAYSVFIRSVRKYIGAYLVTLGRVDAIAFTGGIGENSVRLRTDALADLEPLGITVDPERNRSTDRVSRVISTDDSRITVVVIPTNEELAIAEIAWKFI